MNLFGCASLSCSMWDLSSLTKDRTQAPALGAQSLRYWDHQYLRKLPIICFYTNTYAS